MNEDLEKELEYAGDDWIRLDIAQAEYGLVKDQLRRIANIANQERQKAGASPWWQNVWEIAGGRK